MTPISRAILKLDERVHTLEANLAEAHAAIELVVEAWRKSSRTSATPAERACMDVLQKRQAASLEA